MFWSTIGDLLKHFYEEKMSYAESLNIGAAILTSQHAQDELKWWRYNLSKREDNFANYQKTAPQTFNRLEQKGISFLTYPRWYIYAKLF